MFKYIYFICQDISSKKATQFRFVCVYKIEIVPRRSLYCIRYAGDSLGPSSVWVGSRYHPDNDSPEGKDLEPGQRQLISHEDCPVRLCNFWQQYP